MIDTATTSAPASTLRRVLVWDAPVRVFHWLLAASFIGAWLTAESERWMLVHITLGYTVGGLVAFRVLWGLLGTRHARFGDFVRGPRAVVGYLKSLFGAGTAEQPVGDQAAASGLEFALRGRLHPPERPCTRRPDRRAGERRDRAVARRLDHDLEAVARPAAAARARAQLHAEVLARAAPPRIERSRVGEEGVGAGIVVELAEQALDRRARRHAEAAALAAAEHLDEAQPPGAPHRPPPEHEARPAPGARCGHEVGEREHRDPRAGRARVRRGRRRDARHRRHPR